MMGFSAMDYSTLVTLIREEFGVQIWTVWENPLATFLLKPDLKKPDTCPENLENR